jgi:hypothetical protein
MKRRTAQVLAELKRLVVDAKANLYRRIELAATVLTDLDWIAQVHGGCDLKAQEVLTAEYFPDLGEYISLGKLVGMWKDIPKEEWESLRFNIAAVEEVYDDKHRQTREQGERTSWKKVAEERGERLETMERSLCQLQELSDSRQTELQRLREEVVQLRDENAKMRGRVEELQRLLERQAV